MQTPVTSVVTPFSSIRQVIRLDARLDPLLQRRIWRRLPLYPFLERLIHQRKAPLRSLIHAGTNPMQHQRQNTRELLRLLELGAGLGGVEDEMMMACE